MRMCTGSEKDAFRAVSMRSLIGVNDLARTTSPTVYRTCDCKARQKPEVHDQWLAGFERLGRVLNMGHCSVGEMRVTWRNQLCRLSVVGE
jgi:hypothetical protein